MISIITPVYNSEEYIKETINSIINQTYQNWELILIDDASIDTSKELIREFSEKDKRIKLIELKKNSGAAVARNTGLKNAQGKYIAFIDSDDVWYPQKLQNQLRFMEARNIPISFTSYEVCNEDMSETKYHISAPERINYKGYLKNTIIGMSTSMINKEIVGDFEFINIRTRQDTYLWITLLKRGFEAYGIDENHVKYRLRDTSISANKIKAAKRVWHLYYKLEKLGLLKSTYYFCHYAFNAIKKRK